MEPKSSQPTLSFAIKAAILIGIIYSATAFFALNKIEQNNFVNLILNFTSIASCVFIAQMLSKKNIPNIPYKHLWLTGWMSSLILGVLIAVFFKILFTTSAHLEEPQGFTLILLAKYNIFGAAISALLAFTISKLE